MSIKIYSMSETSASFFISGYNFKPNCSKFLIHFSHLCLFVSVDLIIWCVYMHFRKPNKQAARYIKEEERKKCREEQKEKNSDIIPVNNQRFMFMKGTVFLLVTQIQLFACLCWCFYTHLSSRQVKTEELVETVVMTSHSVTEWSWSLDTDVPRKAAIDGRINFLLKIPMRLCVV